MGERGKPRRKRQEYYQGAYCIFHEMYGHDSTYCGNTDYTMEYKRNQVRKHQACLSCFKTGHKAENCEHKKKCQIKGCNENHHSNLHIREEFDEMRREKKLDEMRRGKDDKRDGFEKNKPSHFNNKQ